MSNDIRSFVYGKIESISKSLDSGRTKAVLAQLRRGVGKKPGEMPELWGLLLENMPESFMGTTGEPSREEWAIYAALTLFALHQQGHGESMNANDKENRLGCAVRKLAHNEDEEERVRFKLSLAASSDDIEELSYRLKTIVRLLSAENIKLDYADLANDMFFFQFENSVDKVRLKWGQDFYRISNLTEDRKEDNNE